MIPPDGVRALRSSPWRRPCRCRLAAAGLALLALSAGAAAAAELRPPLTNPGTAAAARSGEGTAALERRWQELERQLRDLDRLLPPEAAPDGALPGGDGTGGPLPASGGRSLPLLPASLLAPNAPPSPDGPIRALSLEQALAIAFRSSATLQAERQGVAAAVAELQARLGTYAPRISAVAAAGLTQSSNGYRVPQGNGGLGFGPNFAAGGLRAADGQAVDGPFFVPSGARATLSQGTGSSGGGLELDYALLDFARTPAVRAARARLRQARSLYAASLRQLQLDVSEAYYRLQQADQLVRIRDADVRNDLLILQDVLELKQAGLVPRLDSLRRRTIEAFNQERLIQALADRAIARRRLAVLLNLPAGIAPAAADPIRLQPRWPLDLEASLLEAYRDNPELETILATREALARESDAAAAALLPRLAVFAAAGGSVTTTNQWNATGDCCGATVIPSLVSSGSDWSVGLTFRWLLFDAGSSAATTRALARRAAAEADRYVALRNDIRLRLEQAFFQHEASLAKLASARRGVAASLEAFRDARLRYRTGLSSEVDLSLTQDQLIASLVQRLSATVEVNVSYAQLLRELLPVPRDPAAPLQPRLSLEPAR